MNPATATKKSFVKLPSQKPTLKSSKTTLSIKTSSFNSNPSIIDQIFGSIPETPIKLPEKHRASEIITPESLHKFTKSILPHHKSEFTAHPTHTKSILPHHQPENPGLHTNTKSTLPHHQADSQALPPHTKKDPRHSIENSSSDDDPLPTIRSEINHKTNQACYKSSKELVLDVKKCIGELKEEASLYMESGKKKIQSSGCHLKKTLETSENPDSLETEFRDSFLIKTHASHETSEDHKKTPALSGRDIADMQDKITVLMKNMHRNGDKEEKIVGGSRNAPALTKNDIFDLKEKMDMLMMKMNKSDEQAQMHKTENIKLKEAVKELEEKLESVKIFHEPMNMSCNSKCAIF